jgi:Ca-activated chloride channel homolog
LKYFFIITALLLTEGLPAQQTEGLIRQGNRAYKKNDFDKSQTEYRKALGLSPANANANYNLGNASFRKNNFEEAAKSYDATIQSADSGLREKAYYNKGVALLKQKKIDESIEAWKDALKIDGTDSAARDNLTRALMEKKKQQQQNNHDDKKKQDPKDDKNKKNQPPQPKQQQSKLTKQQVEQLLKALAQKEQEVQDKINQNKTRSLTQQEKDW